MSHTSDGYSLNHNQDTLWGTEDYGNGSDQESHEARVRVYDAETGEMERQSERTREDEMARVRKKVEEMERKRESRGRGGRIENTGRREGRRGI